VPIKGQDDITLLQPCGQQRAFRMKTCNEGPFRPGEAKRFSNIADILCWPTYGC
jgi:hypothetical protein